MTIDYIVAELCLQKQPKELGIDGAVSLWDELQWVHITQSNFVHGDGQFLPWHRYDVRVHELLLQTRCNYTGSQPYWDELRNVEAGPVGESPVFDPITGLGGNGTGPRMCVADGPFSGLSLHINDTSYAVSAYCLSRNLSQAGFDQANSKYLDPCMAKDTYAEAWPCFNTGGPHGAGHQGTGGVVSQLQSNILHKYRESVTGIYTGRVDAAAYRRSRGSRILPASRVPRPRLVAMATEGSFN